MAMQPSRDVLMIIAPKHFELPIPKSNLTIMSNDARIDVTNLSDAEQAALFAVLNLDYHVSVLDKLCWKVEA